MDKCPNNFTLAQWTVGDLPPNEMKSVGLHLEKCGDCRSIVTAVEESKTEYETNRSTHLNRLKQALRAVDIQKRAADPTPLPSKVKEKRFGGALLGNPVAMTLAAAAMIAIALVLIFRASDKADPSSPIAFKGSMTFKAVAKRGNEQFFVKNGSALKENDALRFIVTTGSSGYLVVCSVNSRGVVSPFYPDSDPRLDDAPLRLEGSGRHELAGSIILDDQLGKEYLVVAFSKTRFSRRKLHELLSQRHENLDSGEELGRNFGPPLVFDTLLVRKTP